MSQSNAQIIREYGPFPGADAVHGVTYDGRQVWFAAGDKLIAFDPASGKPQRSIEVAAHAGTAFDGRHLYQIVEDRIEKIDPATGRVLAAIPAPGAGGNSGLAWAEGTLWVGQYRDRKIYQVDPQTGAILRTIESRRFVTGVTWVDGELWHGTWEGDESDLRRVDPRPGDARDAAWSVRLGARVRWRRSVLLRRRREREGSGGPPAQARLLPQVAPGQRAFEAAAGEEYDRGTRGRIAIRRRRGDGDDLEDEDTARARADGSVGRAGLEIGGALRACPGRAAGGQLADDRLHGAVPAVRGGRGRLRDHRRRGRPAPGLPEQLHGADPRPRPSGDRRSSDPPARARRVVSDADSRGDRPGGASLRAASLGRAGAVHTPGQRSGDDRGQGRARVHGPAEDRKVRGRVPRFVRLRRGEPRIDSRNLGESGRARQHRVLAGDAAGGARGRRRAAVQSHGAGGRAYRARGLAPGGGGGGSSPQPRRPRPRPHRVLAGSPRRDEGTRHRPDFRRGHLVPSRLSRRPGRPGRDA